MKAIANGQEAVLNKKQLTKAWESVTLASTIGGMVINTAGVTLGHGMEHPASGLKDITHGVGLAVIEPVVVEYTWSANSEKFNSLARIFNHGDGSEPVSYTHLDVYKRQVVLDTVPFAKVCGVAANHRLRATFTMFVEN